VKIVCISDTHGSHESVRLPDGDVLVHAGDITAHGSRDDFHAFVEWFSQQPHKHKMFIGGNHDTYLEKYPEDVLSVSNAHNVIYLNDSGVEINNIRFWGSPITPRFQDWSFMLDEPEIRQHWTKIPDDTQFLITHGPVWGVMDEVVRSAELTEHTGCPALAERVSEIKPAYHVFGHIHEGYGQLFRQGTQYLNVSTMNKNYVIHNEPVVIELEHSALDSHV